MTSPSPSDRPPAGRWDSGQSFIALLFGLAVLAIASAGVFSMVTVADQTARETETQARLDLWKSAIQTYASHNAAALPATLATLQGTVTACSVAASGKLSGYCGPYIGSTSFSAAELRKDSWGTDLVYDSAARTLKSCGANRTCGNTDDLQVSF